MTALIGLGSVLCGFGVAMGGERVLFLCLHTPEQHCGVGGGREGGEEVTVSHFPHMKGCMTGSWPCHI